MKKVDPLQEHLFRSIRSGLPPNISFVHELSELLGISYDSAYRRLRGDKEISAGELKRICVHYNLSADTLFNLQSDHVIFNALAIGEAGLDIGRWLQSILLAIRQIHGARERNIIYAAKDIPVFYYFEFPEIAAFKLYFWNKALIPSSGFENKMFSLGAADELYETGRQLRSVYVTIPTTEIWSDETISSVLRQIEYCFVSGFFVRIADVFRLCDVLHNWLDHVQRQAELGSHFLFGQEPEHPESNFRLYHNEVLVSDNTILVRADNQKSSYTTYNVINQLITTNPVFCNQVEKSLQNLMKNSTLISETSAKERHRFFNTLHDKVRTLRNRIENMESL